MAARGAARLSPSVRGNFLIAIFETKWLFAGIVMTRPQAEAGKEMERQK